jgi:hypothetical protein
LELVLDPIGSPVNIGAELRASKYPASNEQDSTMLVLTARGSVIHSF